MGRGTTYQKAFVHVILLLTVAAVVLAGLAAVAFAVLYWLVDHSGLSTSFVAATLPSGPMGERLDGLGDLLTFSIYTLFHAGYAPYLPHGLDKLIASIEMGTGWLGQLVLLLWALVQLLPEAASDHAR
jgi:hypothetical protein